MAQSVRLSSSLLARFSPRSIPIARRSFATSPIVRADLIQDMYLKEVRAYKPPPQKGPEQGQVAKFTPPAVPKSPEETDLASEMKDYENQVVEVEGQAATGETQSSPEEDYFEDLKQFDEEEAHH